MNGRIAMIAIALCSVLAACSSDPETRYQPDGPVPVRPERVERDLTLAQAATQEQVLLAVIDASDAGVDVSVFRATGVPNPGIVQDRAVLVQVLDAQGRVLSSVSVDNPRDVHTVGSRDPATAVRPSARTLVRLPWSDRASAVQVTVRRGANEGTEERETFDPKALQAYPAGDRARG